MKWKLFLSAKFLLLVLIVIVKNVTHSLDLDRSYFCTFGVILLLYILYTEFA